MRSSLFLSAITLAASVSAFANGAKRHEDGTCAPEPAGVPGYVNNPDTDTTFVNNPAYANAANSASTPTGYTEVFSNLQAAVVDNSAYLGVDMLQSYNTSYCAARCSSSWPGCTSFNIYFERDPTIDPGVNCTNPPSLTYIKCAYYSACITQPEATNSGQYCQQFHVVIAGSNAYDLSQNCSASTTSSTTTTAAATTTPSSIATTTKSTTTTTTTTTTAAATTTKSITTTTKCTTTTSKPTTTSTKSTTTKSTTTSAAPTCSACTGGLTTDKNGNRYNVQCNTNFWGSDLGPVAASCYQDCFDICDKNPNCNAFSWDSTAPPVSCWPKSISSNNNAQPYSENGVVFAQLIPACPACVPGQTTDGSGQVWQVSCNSNFWGSDFVQETAYCYEDCFDLCDNQNGCTAFTFDQTTNICWLKNPAIGSAQSYTEANNVFAQMVQSSQSWQPWNIWTWW